MEVVAGFESRRFWRNDVCAPTKMVHFNQRGSQSLRFLDGLS